MIANLNELKEGDTVIYKSVGYGDTSYEMGENDVIQIKDGKLFTRTFDRFGMTWDPAFQCWEFDSGMGLVTYAIKADDVEGLKYIESYADPDYTE